MEADPVEQEILLLCTMLASQWALEGKMTKQHPAGCVVEVLLATRHQSNSHTEALRRTVIITNFEEDIIQQGNIPNEVIKVFSHYEEERGMLAVIELALEVLLSTDVLVRFLFKTDAGSNPYVRMGVFLQNVGIVFGFVDKVRAELQFKHISLCWPTAKSATPQLNGHTTTSSIPSSSCSASPRSSSSSASSSPSSASTTMGYTQLFSYAGGCGQDLLRKLQPNYQTHPAPVAPLLPTSASSQSVQATSYNQHQDQNDNQRQSTAPQQLIGSASNTTSASVTSTTVASPLITSGNSQTDGERNTLSKNERKRSKPERDFNKDSQLSTTQPAPTIDKGKDKVPNPNREVRKRLEEHREYVGDSDGGSDDGDFDSEGSDEVDSEEEVEQTDSDTDEDEEVLQENNKKKLKTKDNRVTEEAKPKYWKDVYHLVPESQHKHPLSITIGASLWICALCCVENVKKGHGHGPIEYLPKSARFSIHVRNLHAKELTALRSVTSGTKERVLWRCSEGQEAYMDNADFTKAHSISWKELSQAPSVDMDSGEET
ncbi:Nucleolar protein 14 [Balamuthia mandrillaris]